MKAADLDYSGQYGFAPTDSYLKVNHMVVPKAQGLKCNDCHGKEGRIDWNALAYPWRSAADEKMGARNRLKQGSAILIEGIAVLTARVLNQQGGEP